MVQTEDGKHVFDELSEDGRIAIEHTIVEDGRMLYGDADIKSSDAGSGVDVLSSRFLDSSDVGTGTDALVELLATILQSDEGTGTDAWSALLAELTGSDEGTGVETETATLILYLLLKLMQEKELNIELSQEEQSR